MHIYNADRFGHVAKGASVDRRLSAEDGRDVDLEAGLGECNVRRSDLEWGTGGPGGVGAKKRDESC